MIHSEDSALLLNTNIVTYTSGNTTWKDDYEPIISGKELYISFMTLAELTEAFYRKNMSATRIARRKDEIRARYSVIPFTEDICDHFGQIRVARKNRPISVPDAFVAATALAYELPLVSHNKKDFDDIPGLNLISEYRTKK